MGSSIFGSKKTATPARVEPVAPGGISTPEYIGLKTIAEKYIVHTDGTLIAVLAVMPINLDLLNEQEKDAFAAKQAQAFNGNNSPFQIFSIGHSADLRDYQNQLADAAAVADVNRRKVLNRLIDQAKRTAISGDYTERYHYVVLREKPSPTAPEQIIERATLFANRLTDAGTPTRVCERDEIVQLLMLFADPVALTSAFNDAPEDARFA